MIIHVNHLEPAGAGPAFDARVAEVVRTLLGLVTAGHGDPRLLPGLRVHLDWIQYRGNFREPVIVRRASDPSGGPLALAELAVDLRRVESPALAEALARALGGVGVEALDAPADGPAILETWTPLRDSIIWRFNRLFWQRVADWEAASGRRFEEALPSGRSDASRPEAVADSVADFWTLLRDLEKKGQLPRRDLRPRDRRGLGPAGRALARPLPRPRRGARHELLPAPPLPPGDYSLPTLDRAMAAVAAHRDLVSVIPLDALNPLKTLSFLRYKILYIHLTNVYDNLPHDEVVRRDGRLYLVESRGYVPRRPPRGSPPRRTGDRRSRADRRASS